MTKPYIVSYKSHSSCYPAWAPNLPTEVARVIYRNKFYFDEIELLKLDIFILRNVTKCHITSYK